MPPTSAPGMEPMRGKAAVPSMPPIAAPPVAPTTLPKSPPSATAFLSQGASELMILYPRYEVNIDYKDQFEKNGLIFSGLSPDKKLPEIIELKNHPWFIAVQFHPEFKSRPLAPHPLFSSFIKAAKNHK